MSVRRKLALPLSLSLSSSIQVQYLFSPISAYIVNTGSVLMDRRLSFQPRLRSCRCPNYNIALLIESVIRQFINLPRCSCPAPAASSTSLAPQSLPSTRLPSSLIPHSLHLPSSFEMHISKHDLTMQSAVRRHQSIAHSCSGPARSRAAVRIIMIIVSTASQGHGIQLIARSRRTL